MAGLFEKKKAGKAKFPIRWVSYKTRLEEDLEQTLRCDASYDLLSSDYFKSLSEQVAVQDGRIIKIQIFSYAIFGYLALALATPDASLSIFGVAIKDHPGVREVLFFIATSALPLVLLLTTSRDILVWTGDKAASLTTPPEIMPFKRLVLPSSFGSRFYFGQQYKRYLFPTWPTRTLYAVVKLLAALATSSLLLASAPLTLAIVTQIWRNPGLHYWSYACIIYASVVWLFAILWLVRFYCPLPHRDSGVLIKLKELESTDPEAYRELLLKTYE